MIDSSPITTRDLDGRRAAQCACGRWQQRDGMDLKQHIRSVPDFPKAGILFYDITTLLKDPQGFRMTVDMLATPYLDQGIDAVVGIESRGFILGAAVAQRIGAGFIPIRKPGKLPAKSLKESY